MGMASEDISADTSASVEGDQQVKPGSRDSTVVIHNELRRAILAGEIEERSPISQVRLARRFGVSRGPVREALRLLEREGLIEAEVNQRARVAPLSPADLEQLYAMRVVNESLALRISCPLFSDEELDEIDELLDRMDELAGVDVDLWEATHRRFHRALVAHGGVRITRGLEQMYDHGERYRRAYISGDPRAWATGAAEHRAIAKASRQRQPAEAAALLARHLARTALTVLALMCPEHEPTIVRTALRQVTGDTDLP